jgi:nitrite reductase/ring-hydroxylating ferredoxin subunit
VAPYSCIHAQDDGSGPCITCKFHGSKFKLEDGSCVEWSESVMGIPGTKFLGNIVGNVGGAKNSPATVFDVQVAQ